MLREPGTRARLKAQHFTISLVPFDQSLESTRGFRRWVGKNVDDGIRGYGGTSAKNRAAFALIPEEDLLGLPTQLGFRTSPQPRQLDGEARAAPGGFSH